MRTSGLFFARLALAVAIFTPILSAQEKLLPPSDRAPRLILAHNGPHAPVTALAFSPDGRTLYVGGFDKQVRRYQLVKGKYTPAGSFRVPIGTGNIGVVNAVAVSPDGKWVAVAGRAPIRGEVWTGSDDGIGEDSRRLPPLLKRDSGVVYLFDPAKPDGGKVLRGQQSAVRALAFANPAPVSGHVLVTAGSEWKAKEGNDKEGEYVGTVRVFNVTTGAEIASRADLPATKFEQQVIPPSLAAWATGANKTGLRVAVAWDPVNRQAGKLLVWDDPGTKDAKTESFADGLFNSTLAVRMGATGVEELITGGFHEDLKSGGLTQRQPTGAKNTLIKIEGKPGEFVLPMAVAALDVKGVGASTALIVRVLVPGQGTNFRHELRLLMRDGEKTVTLEGVYGNRKPVLAASPDGRFIAVAGFTDNRVEVYDAAAIAAGKPEKLAGDSAGFGKVAFLAGEKLWLGGPTDGLKGGGVILDLNGKARVAAPRGAKEELKIDAPTGAATPKILEANPAQKLPWRVIVTVGGEDKTISLPPGEKATAAAFLPGKPAWDATLGPVLAVAHFNDRSQNVLVKLYDPDGKLLLDLYGPTLAARSLAFSGTHALLAAAGDDGTIVVWSLKNATRTQPAIQGLLVAERGGDLIVAAVQKGSPADGKLKEDEVIESVADAKNVQKPVKTLLDFVLAIRTLKPGDKAKVKVKGKAAVDVEVGVSTGFRHPLFTLWVDPVAKDGKHDWVGWTAAGPYDANSEAAETRIGWLTATDDPARPVTFAEAKEYRKLYYKRDFIRLLIEWADFNKALENLPRPRAPKLGVRLIGNIEERDGQRLAREKPEAVDVTVRDPDQVLDFERAQLRWRVIGPDGTSAWKGESFRSAEARIDLSQVAWKRSMFLINVQLFKSTEELATGTPTDEVTLRVGFVPPPPVLAVQIDGKASTPWLEVPPDKTEVEVAATVDAKMNPEGATVTVGSTGGKPVELRRKMDGTFEPAKVQLKDTDTVIFVTASNRGTDVNPKLESNVVEVRIRKLKDPAKVVPPPTIQLVVLTTHDFRTSATDSYVVSTPKAVVKAIVLNKFPLTNYEWKIGDEDWQGGKLDNDKTELRELSLNVDKPLKVQVRAQSKDSPVAQDFVQIVYQPLPEVSFTIPQVVVTQPNFNLSGGLKVFGKRPFRLMVLVTSLHTGRVREFDATLSPDLTKWQASLTLFPGTNQFGYVIKYDNDRKEQRSEVRAEVHFIRPPAVVGTAPVDAGTGSVGTLMLAVVSPADSPPTELRVNGVQFGFRKPVKHSALGVPVWVVRAQSVPVDAGGERLKELTIVVRNADSASEPVKVAVLGKPPIPVPAPVIQVAYNGVPIPTDQPLGPFGEDRFVFQLKISSETRLSRLEVWHRGGGDVTGVEIGKLDPTAAGAVPGGFELTARPDLRLRPGLNHVRVVASNGGQATESAFSVSFTPPAVRVVIDSIQEPNGRLIPVREGSAAELHVATPIIEVEGRILWDFEDEPIGLDRALSVVFVANGVSHLPVRVQPAITGQKERKFSGRVYLNAFGNTDPGQRGVTRVRVEVRSGERPVPIPQQGLSQATFAVTSDNPLRRQRLHVVVVGVEVPASQRKDLVQRVVRAVGGELPKDNPEFTEGRFTRRDFEFAYLYRPRLEYTNAGDLNALLSAVRGDIERRSRQPNDAWVNDVIVLYYQGEDWVDEKNRWLLHSATTLNSVDGKNLADYAIRLDDLPRVPGMLVGLMNVTSAARPDARLVIDLPFLRYGWKEADGLKVLLISLADAVRAERTVKDISLRVNEKLTSLKEPPTRDTHITEDIFARVFGAKGK